MGWSVGCGDGCVVKMAGYGDDGRIVMLVVSRVDSCRVMFVVWL